MTESTTAGSASAPTVETSTARSTTPSTGAPSTTVSTSTTPARTEPPTTDDSGATATTAAPHASTSAPATGADQLEVIGFVDADEPTRAASVFGFEYGTAVDPEEILATIGGVLGEPDHDSSWQPIPASLSCKGDIEDRSILWKDLRLVLERRPDGSSRLGAWSVGEVALAFSPPLEAEITDASRVTSPSGLGIGSPQAAIANEGFSMVAADGSRVRALTGVSPVVFEIAADDSIVAFSIEDNDCLADDDGM